MKKNCFGDGQVLICYKVVSYFNTIVKPSSRPLLSPSESQKFNIKKKNQRGICRQMQIKSTFLQDSNSGLH